MNIQHASVLVAIAALSVAINVESGAVGATANAGQMEGSSFKLSQAGETGAEAGGADSSNRQTDSSRNSNRPDITQERMTTDGTATTESQAERARDFRDAPEASVPAGPGGPVGTGAARRAQKPTGIPTPAGTGTPNTGTSTGSSPGAAGTGGSSIK